MEWKIMGAGIGGESNMDFYDLLVCLLDWYRKNKKEWMKYIVSQVKSLLAHLPVL